MPKEFCDLRGSADHTLNFHALFTSSLALLLAFVSPGHKQAGINEWVESNIYAKARVPKVRSHDRWVLRRQLPVAQTSRKSFASGRKNMKEDAVCCSNLQRQDERCRDSTVFASLLIYCLFCLCTQRISLLFCKALNSSCTGCKLWLQIICHV